MYLFEDHIESRLFSLFLKPYSNNIAEHFEPLGGSGKILARVDKIHNDDPKATISVFLDLIPDNKNTLFIYRELGSRYKRGYNLMIVPIVCAEYYLIADLAGTNMIKDKEAVDICIKRLSQYEYSKFSDFSTYCSSKNRSKNFESFCKYTLDECIKECIGNRDFEYFNNECYNKCNKFGTVCSNKTLTEKGISYILNYPMFPTQSLINVENMHAVKEDEFKQIHNKLIDDYNRQIDIYLSSGLTTKQCLPIRNRVYD